MNVSLSQRVHLGAVLVLLMGISTFPVIGIAAHGTADLPHPKLEWSKIADDGTRLSEPEPVKNTQVFKINRKQSDGTSKLVDLQPLNSRVFRGHEPRLAALPESIRNERCFVNFFLQPTPAAKPENGTIVNIDGAIIGFQAVASKSDTGAIRAKVLVMDVGQNGKPVWKSAGWTISTNWQSGAGAPARVGVRLDTATNSWALYMSDLLVCDGLPLLSTGAKPEISVRAGLIDTDTVRIADVTVGDHPYVRPNVYVAAGPDGKIDLQRVRGGSNKEKK